MSVGCYLSDAPTRGDETKAFSHADAPIGVACF